MSFRFWAFWPAPVLWACAILLGQKTFGQAVATNATSSELAFAADLERRDLVREILGTAPIRGLDAASQYSDIAYAPSVDMLFASPTEADNVLMVNPRTHITDSTTLNGLAGVHKWAGIVYVPSVDLLFTAPSHSDASLIINPRTNATDITTLSGFGTAPNKWEGLVHVPSVDMVYATPMNADSVLMINPQTNRTDTTTLGGLGAAVAKWTGLAYAPSVDMLFAAPRMAGAVLMINPRTNVTDIVTLGGFAVGRNLWVGIVYVPSVDKLFAAPLNAGAVLVINPRTNVTDNTTLSVSTDSGKWIGIAYAPSVDKLFAAPFFADSVLTVDPNTNATDTLGPIGLGTGDRDPGKCFGIAFASSVDELFAPPRNADAVLTVRFDVDASVVAPLRRVAELTSQLSVLQAQLRILNSTPCNNTVCAPGTRGQNRTCVPDCTHLQENGLSCEPFCDGPVESNSSGRDTQTITVLVVVVVGCVLAFGAVLFTRCRRAMPPKAFDIRPQQPQLPAVADHGDLPLGVVNPAVAVPNRPAILPQAPTAGYEPVLDQSGYVIAEV